MKIQVLEVGSGMTNCYLLDIEGQVLIIDPGAGARRIVATVGDRKPLAVLLTHGHYDHTGAVDALYRLYNLPVYANTEDEPLYRTEVLKGFNGESSVITAPVIPLEGATLDIGPYHVRIYYTPGHSAGSVMFEIEGCLFSGDTLFMGSVGRTDLYSGSYSQLKQSLKILKQLPAEMPVYPGHGPDTTVGTELISNPFL